MDKLIKLHGNKKDNADKHEKKILSEFFDYLQDAIKKDERRTKIVRDKLKDDDTSDEQTGNDDVSDIDSFKDE